jgi:uncharacterized protein (TIGR01370 family)
MKAWIMLCSLFTTLFSLCQGAEIPPKKWVVYYGPNLPPETFSDYQLVVLDPDHHPEIGLLLEQGKTVLGYISLGEVSKTRKYYQDVEKEGILYSVNPHWPESRYVDMRSNKWVSRVIEELIPAILFQRFSGIFIDTIDNAETMEKADPIAFKGMQEAAIRLIRTIRLHYPEIKIMLNRGFSLLPQLEQTIDMELAEGILTRHDFQTGSDSLGSEEIYHELVDQLKALQKRQPRLELYSLDYWNPKDPQGIKSIYTTQRKEGFIPYVSTTSLTEIIPEPK